jgi:redox-sensitive bicupin YhaK (pirin superfamily)
VIKVYKAESRYSNDHGWLKTHFSFSFADYYDPDNMGFGPLRVFNDDMIKPGTGFGAHPHREMEIVSIVLKGALQHQDSMGNTEIIRPGEIQRMTAGTGIVHSEVNPSDTEETHFLQLWFEPDQRGLPPSYEQKAYNRAAMKNNLLPVVSNRTYPDANVAFIHQDMTIYLADLEAGRELSFRQAPVRRIYLFVIEGELTLNGKTTLQRRDAARITNLTDLAMGTESGAHFMLIDLP